MNKFLNGGKVFQTSLMQISLGWGLEYQYRLTDRFFFNPAFSLNFGNFVHSRFMPTSINNSMKKRSLNNWDGNEESLMFQYSYTSNGYINSYYFFTRTKLGCSYYLNKSVAVTLVAIYQLGFNTIDKGGVILTDMATQGQKVSTASSVTRTTSGLDVQLGLRIRI